MFKIKKLTKRTKSDNIFEVYFDGSLMKTVEVSPDTEQSFLLSYDDKNEELRQKKIEDAKTELSSIGRTEFKNEQGTVAWLVDRLGYITSSNTPFKSDGTAIPTIRTYAYRKACEFFSFHNLNLELKEGYKSEAMQHGNTMEDIAIEEYSINTLRVIERKNLVALDGRLLADSIDGIIKGENGGIEVKCPATPLPLIEQELHGTYLDKYIMQIHTHILVNDLDFVDFIVHFDGMKQSVTVVKRDDEVISNMLETLKTFEEFYLIAMEQLELMEL